MHLKRPPIKVKRRKYSFRKEQFSFMIRRYKAVVRLIGICVLILSVITALAYFIFYSKFFYITKFEVVGIKRYVNNQDISQMIDTNIQNKNILFYKLTDLENKLRNNFQGAKDILISKKYPNKLIITIKERTPMAIIYKDDTSEQFLVDEDGYVLGFASKEDELLSRIRYDKEIKPGLFIDKTLVPLYLEMTNILRDEKIKVSSMSIYPKHLSFYIENGPEVMVGNDKNRLQAIKTVDAIIKQFINEEKKIERIDLRYDKVIVLFK